MTKIVLVVIAMVLIPASAFAVDGQVLINQATVAAAGGFPYRITQPGSYKLTGNLNVPSGNFISGIEISVSGVTLDFNGFGLITPPASTVIPGGGTAFAFGITLPAAGGVTIRNGILTGFSAPLGFPPLTPTPKVILEDLVIEWGIGGQSSTSITLGSFSRVWKITSPDVQIRVACPSVVSQSSVLAVFAVGGSGTCGFSNNATLQ